jgi:3-phenylpropionate/trans-cinnamate dioxygenase ferredoxin reductase subunit
MSDRIVVVGASLAGVRTVQALRRTDSRVEIVLIAGEPGVSDGIAADRPPLSKAFLVGSSVAAPPLITPGDLAGFGVDLVTGRATDLNLADRKVVLHGGDAVATSS